MNFIIEKIESIDSLPLGCSL